MHARNLLLHTLIVHNAAMESVQIRDFLAANLRAARAVADLSQETVAARMRALGFTEWQYQTVGKAERGSKKGGRRLTAEEIIALAEALGTTIFALMKPARDDGLIQFPAGDAVSARSIALSAAGVNDDAVTWHGTEPKFSTDSGDVTVAIIATPRLAVPPVLEGVRLRPLED